MDITLEQLKTMGRLPFSWDVPVGYVVVRWSGFGGIEVVVCFTENGKRWSFSELLEDEEEAMAYLHHMDAETLPSTETRKFVRERWATFHTLRLNPSPVE